MSSGVTITGAADKEMERPAPSLIGNADKEMERPAPSLIGKAAILAAVFSAAGTAAIPVNNGRDARSPSQ